MARKTFTIQFTKEELQERSRVFELEKFIRNIKKQENKTPIMLQKLREFIDELNMLNARKTNQS